MTRLRIALVSDWFAPRRGGIEAHLLQLAQRLGERGHAVDVFTSTPDPTRGDAFRSEALHVARLPGTGVAASPRLLQVLRERLAGGYDVVHAHVSVVSPVGYAAAAVARAMGLPTVVTFHSVLEGKRHLLAAANAIAGIGQSGVVWSAVSALVAAQASSALGSPVMELSNGIELGEWRNGGRTRGTGIFTIVSATRLHRKKRARQLLLAFARAGERAGVPARLVIFGDGPERPRLSADIGAFGLDRGAVRAELAGWVGPAELRAAFATGDLFAMASRKEAFGIAALEARAAGLPVVAMDGAGCAEFLRGDEDAVLCADDEDLTFAIAASMRRGGKPSRRTKEPDLGRYDWSAVLAGHERAYDMARTRSVALAEAGAS